MFRKLAFIGSAFALASLPVAGSLAAQDRSSAPVHGANGLKGQNTVVFLGTIAAVALAVVLLPEGNKNSVSP